MWKILYFWLGLCAVAHSSPAVIENRENKWETLPTTPAEVAGFVDTRFLVDGVYQWINQYNPSPQVPLVFVHGGLADHRYWADVARLAIAAGYHVVLVDLRGHGRTDYLKDDKFTYELYIRNIFDLLKDRGLGPDYVLIGWSDGAASVLAALIDPEMSKQIYKAFIFAGFQKPSDTNSTFSSSGIYYDFVSRCRNAYPTFGKRGGQNFDEFAGKVAELEKNYPQFTDDQLRSIQGGKVAICGADRDEAVNLDVAPRLHDLIQYSTLTILKDVTHFAPMQDPQQVWDAILTFLKIPTAVASSGAQSNGAPPPPSRFTG